MAIIKQENILKVLAGFNPWWKTGAVAPAFLKSYKRISYYETLEKISHTTIRRNVILSGARRVGKTTIIYQVIDNLLKQGVAPEQIVFYLPRSSYFKIKQHGCHIRMLSRKYSS